MDKRRKLDETKARALYDKHMYDRQIAEALGVNQVTVMNWRHLACLPSWRDVDAEEHRREAEAADQVAAGKRRLHQQKPDRRAETLLEAQAHAEALGMSYGTYMAAQASGRLPVSSVQI